MKVAECVKQTIENQGREKGWVAIQIGVKYKTFLAKLKNNNFSAEELLKLSKVLGIDLDKLKEEI